MWDKNHTCTETQIRLNNSSSIPFGSTDLNLNPLQPRPPPTVHPLQGVAIGIAVLLTVGQIDACWAGDGMAGAGDGAGVLACISDPTASQVQTQCAITMLLHFKAWVCQLAVRPRPGDSGRLQPQPSHRYHAHHLCWLSWTHCHISQWRYYSDGWFWWGWDTPTWRFLWVLGTVVFSIWVVRVDKGDCHLPAGQVGSWSDCW